MTSSATIVGRIPLRIMQVVALLLIAFKLVQLARLGVFMDESYYWMWGQHPALSYYDHPPLNAWLLGLSSTLFGWNVIALRLPVALCFLADIGAIYLLSKLLGGAEWRAHFWMTVLLFLVTPIFWLLTAYALPDHVLLTCCLFSLYFFLRFFADRNAGGRGADRELHLGAMVLGLAGLAKYNAAFLGVAVAIYVVLFHRALLGELRLYLAAALTLALQAPVVIWNAQQNFASFEFVLHGRHAALAQPLDGVINLATGIVILISPLLFWPIAKFALARKNAILNSGLARVAFVLSTVAITATSLTTVVLFHWNLIAYVAMLPFVAFVMRPRLLLPLQAVYGIAFAVALFINYGVTPLTDVDGWRDEATAWSYGWGPTAQAVEKLRAENKVGFIAAADYTTASLLAFALKDRDVVSLSPKNDAYDYWFDAEAHAGEDAILYGDRWRGLSAAVTRKFDSVTEVTSLNVEMDGKSLNRQRLYLAKGFRPDG